MYCDFATVSDAIYSHSIYLKQNKYIVLFEKLLNSFTENVPDKTFEVPEISKIHSGSRMIPNFVGEYYLKNENNGLYDDIESIIDDIFDKADLHHFLYKLIINDDLISPEYRREAANNHYSHYTDDTALTDLICDAMMIAMIRPYTKSDNGTYVARSYFNSITVPKDKLFSNGKPVAPCKHFCGRSEELKELHDLLQTETKLIITGIAGIGKSEFIRAYIKEYRKEYSQIGYYFYNGSLKSIIAEINGSSLDSNIDSRYQDNLELLSTFDKNTLLVIDNFNAGIEDDDCFEDLLNLECTVVFTSHKHYDDICTYNLKEFRLSFDYYDLIKYFYPFDKSEESQINSIIFEVSRHTYAVELCARLIKKGLYTPRSLIRKISGKNLSSIFEKFSATKDKHIRKNSYYDHIKELFNIIGLPKEHQNVLRMLVATGESGVRKDFMAMILQLDSMAIIEDLVDVGLVYEFPDGKITVPGIIKTVITEELRPNAKNCEVVITSIKALSLNEAVNFKNVPISEVAFSALRNIEIFSIIEKFDFCHHCFKCAERERNEYYMNFFLIEQQLMHPILKSEQLTISLSDEAAFNMMWKNLNDAISLQEKSVETSKNCDNILLQSNTLSTYGYYLNLADRKQDALKPLKIAVSLLEKLDSDVFYFDKYRTIINYSDLVFSLGDTADAINKISDAIHELQNFDMTKTEIYADCLYSLGLYHLCTRNSDKAKSEIIDSLRIYLNIHELHSDFMQSKVHEIQNFSDMLDAEFMSSEIIKRLLG